MELAVQFSEQRDPVAGLLQRAPGFRIVYLGFLKKQQAGDGLEVVGNPVLEFSEHDLHPAQQVGATVALDAELFKRSPARGRAPPVHENMAKPLVTVAESIDLSDGDRREVGLEQVNQSRSRD